MPKISVIVPVYRVEKYIRRCVDSILAQTFQNFELILVDDGSPDNSGAICDEYAAIDSRIHVIHKENGGLASARNAGIDAAQGEYLFFMDSDDVIHPDCLHILEECIRLTGAEIALGEFARFSSDAISPDEFAIWDGNFLCMDNIEALQGLFHGDKQVPSCISACCKIFYKALFQNIRFPVGKLFEDEFTTYKLYYESSKTVFVPMVLYYYFDNFNGITRNLTLSKRFDQYDAEWERLHFFREHRLDSVLRSATLTFLNTAQWDMIQCRKGSASVDAIKKQRFQKQFKDVFGIAVNCGYLDFLSHYDYFILAKPEYTFFWRLLRFIKLSILPKIKSKLKS